jgi:hypothetical protein
LIYTFDAQYTKGAKGEAVIDWIMRRFVDLQPVTRQGQKDGIDRVYRCRDTGTTWTVEYKTDFRAMRSGNVFLETVSQDTNNKAGWLYTSKADYLLFYIPYPCFELYLARMETIRRQSLWWEKRYPKGGAKNPGYSSRGILVPLTEFENYCDVVLRLCVDVPNGRKRSIASLSKAAREGWRDGKAEETDGGLFPALLCSWKDHVHTRAGIRQ